MKLNLPGVVAWARQITTGAGFTALLSAAGAYVTHAVTGPQAAVGAICAVMLMIWPEANKTRVAAVVQAVQPPAEIAMKDVAAQVLAKHIDLVTDIKDVVALATAAQSVLPLPVPAAPAAVPAGVAGATAAAAIAAA